MLPLLPPAVQVEVASGVTDHEKTSIPGFVSLYRYLTARCLDHECATQIKNNDHETEDTVNRLKEHHTRIAKDMILVKAIKEMSLTAQNGLPRELRELCSVIAAYLIVVKTDLALIDQGTVELLADDMNGFQQDMPEIAESIGQFLIGLETIIIKLLEMLPHVQTGSTNATGPTLKSRIPSSRWTTSRTYTPIMSASVRAADLLSDHQASCQRIQREGLPAVLVELSVVLNNLLEAQSQLLTSQIRHTELHTYSSFSRHAVSQATFLNAVAQGLNLKTQIFTLQREKEVYAEEGIREALQRDYDQMSQEERNLDDTEGRLKRLLAEYDDAAESVKPGSEGVFERLGQSYAEIEREIEAVRKDIAKLEAGKGTQRRKKVAMVKQTDW